MTAYLEKLIRYVGVMIIKNRIMEDLYRRHYYWDGEMPLSPMEITTLAVEVEALYYRAYLAP